MHNVLIAPRKYVQGRGALAEAGKYFKILGRRPLVLWDSTVKDIVGETLLGSLAEEGIEPVDVDFRGDCTHKEADRVIGIIRETGADMAVGVGGGKTLDTAKAAGIATGIRIVTCPTIASNDSPTSAASVWYDEDGNCIGFVCWPFNPDLVLVDSLVISRAPARALVAGMGDALATWVEAKVALQTGAGNIAGGVSTLAAMTIAELGYGILLEHGFEAKRAVEAGVLTPSVEKVIEANILHSGLGFESGGLATAHMIANCLPSFPECRGLMHGEEVAFGVISQLCLDNAVSMEEVYEAVDFEVGVGLPVTFEDIGLMEPSREQLKIIGDVCAGKGSLCESHCFKVTSEAVVDAMIAADALGAERKEAAGVL
ncbi:MAG: glycerol dehydrogenase [Sedimentisphaerales bacterium]|nr:glycerol dehydrogenase [Sedimentisphaerales bacterium]